MTPDQTSSVLKPRQQRRVEALLRARDALAASSFMSKGKADAIDLVAVASWVVTGDDPWPGNQPEAVVK